MKARKIILTITATALIAGAGVVFAQHTPGNCDGSGPHGPQGSMGGPGDGGTFGGQGGHGFMQMLPRLADKLDLTQEQQDQIQAIIDAGKPDLDALREQAQTARDEFRELYPMSSFDETTFRSHFESQAQLHVEMQLIGADLMSQAWAVLTTEQQEELQELMELFGNGRGGPRNGGGKRHGVH
jgi:Spy/CpxP family protein refolding chaperone